METESLPLATKTVQMYSEETLTSITFPFGVIAGQAYHINSRCHDNVGRRLDKERHEFELKQMHCSCVLKKATKLQMSTLDFCLKYWLRLFNFR